VTRYPPHYAFRAKGAAITCSPRGSAQGIDGSAKPSALKARFSSDIIRSVSGKAVNVTSAIESLGDAQAGHETARPLALNTLPPQAGYTAIRSNSLTL
jgi:hypothetical protein